MGVIQQPGGAGQVNSDNPYVQGVTYAVPMLGGIFSGMEAAKDKKHDKREQRRNRSAQQQHMNIQAAAQNAQALQQLMQMFRNNSMRG